MSSQPGDDVHALEHPASLPTSDFLANLTLKLDRLNWPRTSQSPDNGGPSEDGEGRSETKRLSISPPGRAGLQESTAHDTGKRNNAQQYMSWLSNRQAQRRSANPYRHAGESSGDSSPSIMHPYGRRPRLAERAGSRQRLNEGFTWSNAGDVASCSSENLGSASGSPAWSHLWSQPHPPMDSVDSSTNSRRHSPFPGQPQRGHSMPLSGQASPIFLGMRPRARTAGDFVSEGVLNPSSMSAHQDDILHQLNMQGAGEPSKASSISHNVPNPPQLVRGYSAPDYLSMFGAHEASSLPSVPDPLPPSTIGLASTHASFPGISSNHTLVPASFAPGFFHMPPIESPEQVGTEADSFPFEIPAAQVWPSGGSVHGIPKEKARAMEENLSNRSLSPSDSTDLRNAYQAMTRSLQMDSFDWAQSPNSNGSFSQHENQPDQPSKSRTHDLTMSWLQRGLPQVHDVQLDHASDQHSEDNLDLLAEDMMDTQSYSPVYHRSSLSTAAGEPPLDVFDINDRIGPGLRHDGQLIRVAEGSDGFVEQDFEYQDKQLQVDKLLGYGSYAVVYLVHEVPEHDRTPIDARFQVPVAVDPQTASVPHAGLAGKTPVADEQHHVRASRQESTEPRKYALKCLSKQNLSPEMLDLQRTEAFIHQSIPKHPNIITLYCTYETSDWLFLVMEYCPGQDLYFWLEEADLTNAPSKHPSDKDGNSSAMMQDSGNVPDEIPSTPWLLARTSPHMLLSEERLKCVGEMFYQMCEAVQFCHDRGISHRDIKPENFIVQDMRSTYLHRASVQEAVVVKLTDFGLATTKDQCDDFNCGSKPYMAFECRHNLAKTYDPKQADVWSLGIVLLNLLFHRSPFKEPSVEHCASFSAFSFRPTLFLTEAFDGLTTEVAQFLCANVFCDVSQGRAHRISAHGFGEWAKQLPRLLGQQANGGNREPRGACSSVTSPLQLSRAPSMHRMTDSVPHSPLLERQALANSWSQAHPDTPYGGRRRSSAASLSNTMLLTQPLTMSEEREHAHEHTRP